MAQLAKNRKTPTKAKTPTTARRKRPMAKTARKPVRRRAPIKKKGLLGDMFAPNDVENGFKMLISGAIGFYGSEKLGAMLNPDGTKNQLEIGAKLVVGFLAATAGKMPALGVGIMSSGFKRMTATVPLVAGLGDNREMSNKNINYLNDAPKVIDTGMYMNDNGQMFLNDNGMNLQDYRSEMYQSSIY